MKLAFLVGVVGSVSLAAAQPAPPPPPPAGAVPAPAPPPAASPSTPTPLLTPAPPPAAPPLSAFLQQRVAEELAADGIILSRLNVRLEIEAIGDKLLVSLVDLTTGRASASTKVDRVPAEREAAVASVTQVVAVLSGQLDGPRPPSTIAPDVVTRDELAARERAQLAYQEEAIGFGDEYELMVTSNSASLTRRWTVHRGELHEPLSPTDFYRTVGRPDLADEYDQRRNIKIGAIVGTVIFSAVSVGLLYKGLDLQSCLDDPFANGDDCADEHASADRYLTGGYVTLALAAVGSGVWAYYYYRPHPISEGEAKRLGAEHNRALRIRLGLPVAHAPRGDRARVEVGVAPYVAPNGGGLSLAATF